MNFILLLLPVLFVTIVDAVPLKDELLRRKAIESARKLWDPILLKADYSTNSRFTYPAATGGTTEPTIFPTPQSSNSTGAFTETSPYPTVETTEYSTTEVPSTTSPPPSPPRKPFIKVVFDYLLKFRFEFEVNKNR